MTAAATPAAMTIAAETNEMTRAWWKLGAFGLALALACGFATPADAQAPRREVRIWMSAFIPDSHPTLANYFKRTATGTSVLGAPPVPGFGAIGTCFTTDNRGFSANPNASARVTVGFMLDINGRTMSVRDIPGRPRRIDTGWTHNVDCASGAELRPARKAPTTGVSVSEVAIDGFLRTVDVRASAGNPFYDVFDYNIAPKIDFRMRLQYDILQREIRVTGAAGDFPSFEAYYQVDGGPVRTLTQLAPDGGATSLIDLWVDLNMRDFNRTISLH